MLTTNDDKKTQQKRKQQESNMSKLSYATACSMQSSQSELFAAYCTRVLWIWLKMFSNKIETNMDDILLNINLIQ